MQRNLDDAYLTLSGEKSAFEQEEILVVGHLCRPYGLLPIGVVRGGIRIKHVKGVVLFM